MQNKTWPARAALSIGVAAVLFYTPACGVRTTPPQQHASQSTYLYVGEAFVPPDPSSAPSGFVAQFRVENDGTLTALNPSTTASVVPFFAAAVAPSNQHLFIPNGAISEFGIGGDGKLTPNTTPPATGSSIAFTPSGQLALIAKPSDNTLTSYGLGPSGALVPINTVATGGFPQTVTVDGSGTFAYVTNSNDDTISEYTISSGGILTPNGSIASGGVNPRALVVSPKGFLYCGNLNGNTNSRSVTTFSINASSGTLTLVSTYVMPTPLWISFDPTGTYAYVGDAGEMAQFTVDGPSGGLTGNGTTPTPNGVLWGGVDPSGRFLFAAGIDGTVSQFIISNTGTLIANGSVSLGANMVSETLAFAQQ